MEKHALSEGYCFLPHSPWALESWMRAQTKKSALTTEVFAIEGILPWFPGISFPICLQNWLYAPWRSRTNHLPGLATRLLKSISARANFLFLKMHPWAAGSAAYVCIPWEDTELSPFECFPIAFANKKAKVHLKPNFHKVLEATDKPPFFFSFIFLIRM